MDCLTGYGSDSDESSSSGGANNAVSGGDNQAAKTAPLSGLLGDGIDSCSSSSDDDEETQKHRSRTHPSSSSVRDNDRECSEQAKKKQRTEVISKKIDSFREKNGLPCPRTVPVDATQSASMISWTTDYISKTPSQSPDATDSTDRHKFEKFKKLAASQSYDAKKGWAVHLRNQNGFHNPHFIQSVIEHFGIDECLGSQAVSKTKN